MVGRLKKIIIGKRMATKAIGHERLSNWEGFATFCVDAISSTAYATEEILLVLILAHQVGALQFSIPFAVTIAGLIFLVSVSYQQVVRAYPQGGGVYNVAKENLGELPALLGGSSLLIDYVLTVAVSVAAGVAAITSAFPALWNHRVAIGIAVIMLLQLANLRGIRESGKISAIAVYGFILCFAGLIGYGILSFFTGSHILPPPPEDIASATQSIGIMLLLRAFASGCTAMTGIEATSNGVQAFQKPESENAAKVLMRMACTLGIIFIGITVLASWLDIRPSEHETVISQIARTIFGTGPLYFAIQTATTLVLLLAANTPFAGFPRVASQLAEDWYFPRQFLNLGSRLVFANGIIALAVVAAFLLFVFGGSVHALIPLYAVGVFLGFSLSQLGMIVHWKKIGGEPFKIGINVTGFVATTIVFCIVFVTKFTHGAWILIPAILLLIFFMKKVKRHYIHAAHLLKLDDTPIPSIAPNRTMVVLVSKIDRAALYAIQFARIFDPAHLCAVHIALGEDERKSMKEEWNKYVPDVPLHVMVSEDRDLFIPLADYFKTLDGYWKDDSIIAVIPEFIPDNLFHHFLHNQTALRLKLMIENDPTINVELLTIPIRSTTPLRTDLLSMKRTI